MTAKELIIQTPQHEGESNEAYFRRLSNPNNAKGSIKKAYYKIKRSFVTTQKKYDKNDNLISRTEKLQSKKLLLPPEHLELSRLSTNESTGQQWQIYTKESEKKALFELNKETIKQTIKELDLKPLDVPKIKPQGDKVLKLIYTDTHIAMNIENDLYGGGFWNEDLLFETLKIMVSEVKDKFDNHSKIIVDDYGDLMDGMDAMTTRRNHKIPQNMNNIQAYKAGVRFKVELAKELSMLGVDLEFHNVVNSNHGGDYEHIVNLGAKETLKYLLPEVKYNIYPQFISHYIVNGWCFLLCHGKDKEFLKFGFKPQLNEKAKDHIISYIDRHDLHKYRVVFCKGDSHLHIQDASNPKFEYNSYMCLSPNSEWVSVNFAKGRRGFCIEELNGKRKTSLPIWL